MSEEPATRQTLLLRLRDSTDDASWAEFAEIYTPLLYGYCQKRELRHADCADIVQEVMRSVSLAMENFRYDPAKGKFKAWLFTAVRHAVGNHLRKQSRRPLTIGETALLQTIDSSTPDSREGDEWELDYERQILAWALEKIRPEFAVRIWNAFKATAIDDQSPDAVARELGMTKNAVALAKFRVMKRLKEYASGVDEDSWEQEMITKNPRNPEIRL